MKKSHPLLMLAVSASLFGTQGWAQAPGAAGSTNAAKADSAKGMGGAVFSQAPIGVGSHCNSVVLQDASNKNGVAWVLPRVFLGVNRFRQQLFDIAAPTTPGEKWRLRFSLFIPHNVNDVINSRGDEDGFFTHGCDFAAVARELEAQAEKENDAAWEKKKREFSWMQSWFETKPAPDKYTLIPVLPYKLHVTVDGYGDAWIPSKDEGGAINTTALHTYGWDHEVTIPFNTEADLRRFLRDFDRDNKIGVKATVDVHFAAARKNGSIKCSAHSASIETSLKTHFKAKPDFSLLAKALGGPEAVFAKDPVIDMLKIDLKGEMSNSFTSNDVTCDLQASTSDAFNQMAMDISKSVVADILPNMLSISQQSAQNMAGGLPQLPNTSIFNPLPPLPGPIGPEPCQGVDPVVFSQQNNGALCEPGSGDKDKHYVKLSALMSSIRKIADKNVDINLTAPPTDETFTTFIQLIGKPENKAHRDLLVPSSLGPVQVSRTTEKVVKTNGRGQKYTEMGIKTTEKTMANGRGFHTGVEMPAGRVVRLYPIKRVFQNLTYEKRWRWATWKDIRSYTKEGVDFRIQWHSYQNATWTGMARYIEDLPNSEIENQAHGFLGERTFPVFAGLWYDRAFKIISRPRTIANRLEFPFTEVNLFGAAANGNGVADPKTVSGFNIGFRGIGKIYDLTTLLTDKDASMSVTKDIDGDGRPYIEIAAKKDLGELTLFNMDNHGCTNSVEVNGVKNCQPDWASRVYVQYGRLLNLAWFGTTGIVDPYTLSNDDVAHVLDPYLRSSDIDAFKQILPTSRSILEFDLDIRTGVESDIQKIIAKKLDSISLSADPQVITTSTAGLSENLQVVSPIAVPPTATPSEALAGPKQP